MPSMVEAIDLLRGRFTRLRKGRSLKVLEKDVRVNTNTLQGFLRGVPVNQTTLQAIEDWCNTQEDKAHA